ncbi:MAG TPA: hypothetical protein VGS41_18115, partial [Chthonomonadales bacterium]|nr:hypothetical protein [Chthonomonadales bacterium]
MDDNCLKYKLTAIERDGFEETGMLVVEDALNQDLVAHLTALADATFHRALSNGHSKAGSLFYPNFIPEDPAYVELVDHPMILPKVWGILGWNIYLYHAHL